MALNLNLGLDQCDPWTIRKTLEQGDLAGSVSLPKDKMMNKILPEMANCLVNPIQGIQLLFEYIEVKVRNLGSNDAPRKIRIMQERTGGPPNYGTFYFKWGWTEFSQAAELKAGDEIGLFYDKWNGEFKFHVLNRA